MYEQTIMVGWLIQDFQLLQFVSRVKTYSVSWELKSYFLLTLERERTRRELSYQLYSRRTSRKEYTSTYWVPFLLFKWSHLLFISFLQCVCMRKTEVNVKRNVLLVKNSYQSDCPCQCKRTNVQMRARLRWRKTSRKGRRVCSVNCIQCWSKEKKKVWINNRAFYWNILHTQVMYWSFWFGVWT